MAPDSAAISPAPRARFPVLAFDCAGPYCAVAVQGETGLLAECYAEMTKGQAECLMPMIAETVADAGLLLSDIATIAVGVGPGNFTGIRIAVAAARGLALSLDCPATGVSTLEAIAHRVGRPTLAVTDARREQVYVQTFDRDGGVAAPQLLPIDALSELLTPGTNIATRAGVEMFAPLKRPITVIQPPENPAPAIAAIAAARAALDPAARPAPIYLRAADAAPARDTGPVILS